MDKNKKSLYLRGLGNLIISLIYYAILIPLLAIALMIVYQSITEPDKIPDVFGWKIFMILDGNMDESIEYGDLVFTKNIDTKMLKENDVIAFRNAQNTVTIHRIINIENKEENRLFYTNALPNETNDTKVVKDTKVEGKLEKIIPYIRNCNNVYSATFSASWVNSNNNSNRISSILYSPKN